MAVTESLLAAAIVPSRDAADRALARLDEHDIAAVVAEPDSRHHGLAPGALEIRVPATQAARARAILSADDK